MLYMHYPARSLIYLYTVFSLFLACQPAEDYKVVRNEVVKEHDRVMIATARAERHRSMLEDLSTKLDSLKRIYSELDTTIERSRIRSIINDLEKAD